MSRVVLAVVISILVVSTLSAQQESFDFGKRMYRDGFYPEAILVFERITETSPMSSEAEESLFLLGEIHRHLEDFEKAEIYYQKFYERYSISALREQALYYWSLSIYQQDKYNLAINLLNNFIDSYPASQNKPQALFYLIESYYNISSYQSVITRGQEFLRTFSKNERAPDVLYLMALSYLKTNNRNDADNTFMMIKRDYPASNARWETLITQSRLIVEEIGAPQALNHLLNEVDKAMPRQYEEQIRHFIAELYILEQQYREAVETLDLLISRFDRSPRFSEYLYYHALSLLRLNRYSRIIDVFQKIDLKEIRESEYYIDYLLKVAETYFIIEQDDQTESIIKGLSDLVTDDRVRYQVNYWQARIKERHGRFFEAINDYHFLMSNYPLQVRTEQVLMRIGDIYFEKLQMYQTAINYYNQVVAGITVTNDYHWRALYKMALCYEILGDYAASLASLRQINTDYVSDDAAVKDILMKTEFTSRFKIIDHQQVSENLISSLFRYVLEDNKDELKESLIEVMLLDMKSYDNVILMLENDTTPQGYYYKGRAYLKGLHMADLEKRTDQKTRYLEGLNRQISNLDRQNHAELLEELLIERDYIMNNYSFSAEQLRIVENYVEKYPSSSAANRFHFMIGSHYLKERVYAKADEHLRRVVKDSEIPIFEYENAMVQMGNYFFDNGLHDRVISYFERIEKGVNINRPDEMYRYAVSSIKTGAPEQGLNMLEFLVKNTTSFDYRNKAIMMIADHYRNKEDYQKAIAFMLLFPDRERESDFHIRISEDFLMIGDENRAKEALMYIPDKDEQILLTLADLHYRTGDLLMAELTYDTISKEAKDRPSRLIAQSKLAHINFIQEKWREAVTGYETVLEQIGDPINTSQYDYLDLLQIGKESVIALYRVQNRPRADTIRKRFRDVFGSDRIVVAEIDLNEAVYQMSINRNRAERGFSDLIRDRSLPHEVRMQAHFWRGLNHLENKKISEAQADFQSALLSNDPNLLSQAHLKLGTISFSQEQYQQAMEHYYWVIQNDETKTLAFDAAKNLAIVSKTIEEWQRAIEAYEIILEKWGDEGLEGETLFNIAYCQFRDRKYGEAVQSFEKAIPLLADREMRAEAQYWIGESYFSLGQFDKAATEYLKVGYFYPEYQQWSAISELKLAESYIRQGRIENARNILNKIIQNYGRNSDWGKQALIYLEQL